MIVNGRRITNWIDPLEVCPVNTGAKLNGREWCDRETAHIVATGGHAEVKACEGGPNVGKLAVFRRGDEVVFDGNTAGE